MEKICVMQTLFLNCHLEHPGFRTALCHISLVFWIQINSILLAGIFYLIYSWWCWQYLLVFLHFVCVHVPITARAAERHLIDALALWWSGFVRWGMGGVGLWAQGCVWGLRVLIFYWHKIVLKSTILTRSCVGGRLTSSGFARVFVFMDWRSLCLAVQILAIGCWGVDWLLCCFCSDGWHNIYLIHVFS